MPQEIQSHSKPLSDIWIFAFREQELLRYHFTCLQNKALLSDDTSVQQHSFLTLIILHIYNKVLPFFSTSGLKNKKKKSKQSIKSQR